MQINNKIGWGIRIIFLWMIFSLHACCNDKEENEVIPICIASNHSLMALVPDFSIQTVGNTLHTKYPKLSRNKEFPMIGILKVDGKSYRFMGGLLDTLICIQRMIGCGKNMMIRSGITG